MPLQSLSLMIKVTTALDIMPFCASESSRGRLAGALEVQSDAPRLRLHVSILGSLDSLDVCSKWR